MRIQDDLSATLCALRYYEHADAVKTETDPQKLRIFARCVLRNVLSSERPIYLARYEAAGIA